jgi:acyl transferase domain-containing protein
MSHSTTLAFVFPGQGSQSLGMLAELAVRHDSVRETFDQASAGCGLDLWTLSQEGPESELNRTEVTQPALIWAVLRLRRSPAIVWVNTPRWSAPAPCRWQMPLLWCANAGA